MSGVTAIVKNQGKVIVLNSIHHTLHILGRKLHSIFVREKTGSRFGHHHTSHTRFLDSLTIVDNEGSTFIEKKMHRIGLDVNSHHNFVHIVETTCQRERTDTTGKNRTIGDISGRKHVGHQILRNTTGRQRRDLQSFNFFGRRKQTSTNRRNFVFGHHNGRTESLSFNRQVHNERTSRRRIFFR